MSHGIGKNDLVYSTMSTEWHGLAHVKPELNENTIRPILFPIIGQQKTYTRIETPTGIREIQLDNRQSLVADLSYRNTLSPEDPEYLELDDCYTSLHTPTDHYTAIPNKMVWDTLQKAIKDLDVKVVTAGTIDDCAKFFICVDIGDSELVVRKNDPIMQFLNFTTSHDGKCPVLVTDNGTRIVCKNTFVYSMSTKGQYGFKVYHTSRAEMALHNVGELFNSILHGRKDLKNQLEYLLSIEMSVANARALAMSFFGNTSTQSLNLSEEIAHLFQRGMGNEGKNAYDLWNGFTECYTHGSGTGKNASLATKYYKSNFGTPATKKQEFLNFLTGANFEVEIERGNRLISALE